MSAFILTWNPQRFEIPDEEWDAEAALRSSRRDHSTWATGNRTGGMNVGDIVYLLRQHNARGIVLSGTVIGGVYQDRHFDGRGVANYVDYTVDAQVAADDRLPTEVLVADVPEVKWMRLQGSGVQVPPAAEQRLAHLWADHLDAVGARPPHPDEVADSEAFTEGAVTQVLVNRYERDPTARRRCLDHHGAVCVVCRTDYEDIYGSAGAGLIHVHHLVPLHEVGGEYRVDPVKDLVPVCPNCHTVLHRENPPIDPKALRARLLRRQARSS
jgi:5-methylcytosine-specific restriction protein A